MKIAEKEKFEQANVFGTGAPNTGFAQYFSGDSYLNPLTEAGKCPVFLANVTFEPGRRPVAATTGIFTRLRKAADRCLSVWPDAAGIRKRERKR